jgi:hypothetical protein
MALTAAQLIALAAESAHSPGKKAQALNLLNSILSDVCQERDFAEARGQFLFSFTPNQRLGLPASVATPASVWGTAIWGESLWGAEGTAAQPAAPPAVWPGVQFGSGPYLMPLDFLRLSGSSGSSGSQKSFLWWLNGVPYAVLPMDLADFDMQVQQTGLESYVWLAATDMSAPIDDRYLLQTTADLVAGSTELNNLGSTARLIGGNVLGVAGQGISPGTMLTSLPSSAGGMIGSGPQAVVPPGEIGVLGSDSQAIASGLEVIPGQLSLPAVATITGASIFFGYCPVIFVWPPPVSALQAMIRYQKQMPPITDTTRFPWMHNDRYLLTALTGRMCALNDDARADTLTGAAEDNLTNFLAMKDDEQSHPKRVELDRRAFGHRYSGLGPAKRTGQIY